MKQGQEGPGPQIQGQGHREGPGQLLHLERHVGIARRENGGKWMGWVVAEVHGGRVGRRLRLSKYCRERGRSFRQRCIYGLPFLLREWCRNTWLSASQGAGWANKKIGHSSPNPHLPQAHIHTPGHPQLPPPQPTGIPFLTVHIKMAKPNHDMPHV